LTGCMRKATVVSNLGVRVQEVSPQSLHKLLADWQAGDQKALDVLSKRKTADSSWPWPPT
jgi:hypothetical protein